jgi:hypothetical protein
LRGPDGVKRVYFSNRLSNAIERQRYGNIQRVNGLTLGEIGPGAGQIALVPCGDERKIFPSGSKIMETITVGGASKMTSKVVYDPKPRAYKAVRVWLSNGRRLLGIWTGAKWWSVEGEIEPVKWELEERRKKTDKLRKAIPRN